MKRRVLLIIATVILIAGLALLLFAPVSNLIGSVRSNEVSDQIDAVKRRVVESVENADGETASDRDEAKALGLVDEYGVVTDSDGNSVVFQKDLNDLRADSERYNERLLTSQGTADTVQYEKPALDITRYGVPQLAYCYVSAESIGMRLPVFLGASESVMAFGAGHLYGTSLPLGEESENCALAGHTGYIGRIFFDHLRKLSVGDEVSVTNLWDTIDYRVVDTRIVSEDYVNDIVIERGRTLLTLITCISDGSGGFDRFLVICEKQ